MLNMLKKKTANEKTAIKITQDQKVTTTVANISGKIKTGAFGVATGAGIAGTMMLQNERGIHNRKARAAYHKKVEAVCTVAVGAAVVGAGAALVQGIFDPVVDMTMLEIEPEAYCKLHNKAGEFDNAETGSEEADGQDAEQPAEHVVAEIVPEKETDAPASAPAEQPVASTTATEVQTPDPKDGQPVSSEQNHTPVDPQAEQPVAPAPAPVAAKVEQPANTAATAQTNQGDNGQQPKSDADKHQPKGQGAGNKPQPNKGNGQNGNNNKNANATK